MSFNERAERKQAEEAGRFTLPPAPERHYSKPRILGAPYGHGLHENLSIGPDVSQGEPYAEFAERMKRGAESAARMHNSGLWAYAENMANEQLLEETAKAGAALAETLQETVPTPSDPQVPADEQYPPEPRVISTLGRSAEYIHYMLWRASVTYGLHEVFVFESPEAAQQALDNFREGYPKLAKWMAELHEEVKDHTQGL